MRPLHPAADRLHLDMLWWTAGAETSARGIHRRACRMRSSRLPSLPQLSRSYDLPPPTRPRLAHSGCPQSRAAPPVILRSDAGSCPQCCARKDLTPFSWLTSCILRPPTVLHAVAAPINGDDLYVMWNLENSHITCIMWTTSAFLLKSFQRMAGVFHIIGMMQEPVEQGRGKHLVSEQLS